MQRRRTRYQLPRPVDVSAPATRRQRPVFQSRTESSGAVQSLCVELPNMLTVKAVNQDPMDPKFNLEAFFDALVKEKP